VVLNVWPQSCSFGKSLADESSANLFGDIDTFEVDNKHDQPVPILQHGTGFPNSGCSFYHSH